MNIINELYALQDEKYKAFQSSLIPTLNPDLIIGVRTPQLKKLAKEIINANLKDEILNTLPHKYYEENQLHGFIISNSMDFDECINMIEAFLPYINNWATCDLLNPKILKKDLTKLYSYIIKWINSGEAYTIRFGIKCLMNFYLDDNFDEAHLKLISNISSDEYYVNMMIAWYVATALSKQYSCTIKLIENKALNVWIHNKSIQKARESLRIDSETKEYLKTLKIDSRK